MRNEELCERADALGWLIERDEDDDSVTGAWATPGSIRFGEWISGRDLPAGAVYEWRIGKSKAQPGLWLNATPDVALAGDVMVRVAHLVKED